VIRGVSKGGRNITIVVRPANQRKMKFSNELEVAALAENYAELWVDNGSAVK
jgi:hypothetical protein